MTVYELAKTPTTPGLFLRNRANAISVRSQRRRKNVDQNDNEIFETESKPQRQHRKSRYSSEFDTSANLQSKSEEILSKSYRRERAYSNDWDGEFRKNRKSFENEDFDDDIDIDLPPRPVSRRDFERKSEVFSRSRSRIGYRSNGPMETLDRRISASTDNLDTLKREKRSNRHWDRNQDRPIEIRPRSVSSRAQSRPNLETEDDITFRINGEKMSKNKYFFGTSELKSALKPTKSANRKTCEKPIPKNRKTALDIFLEDKGPYSRKLYGPPPETESSDPKSQRKRTRSQEAILQEVSSTEFLPRS